MANTLFDRRHLREYTLYGTLAGLAYSIPVLLYLAIASYYYSAILFIGSILFMFVILIYSITLTRRRPDYKSTWMMIIAGHMAIFIGIAIAVICATILCFVFIPGFLSGNSQDTFLSKAPQALNKDNEGTLMLIYVTATIVNFGAGAFMSVLVSYVIKLNQTKDKSPSILQEQAPPPGTWSEVK